MIRDSGKQYKIWPEALNNVMKYSPPSNSTQIAVLSYYGSPNELNTDHFYILE